MSYGGSFAISELGLKLQGEILGALLISAR
jgi:hypothetical protein